MSTMSNLRRQQIFGPGGTGIAGALQNAGRTASTGLFDSILKNRPMARRPLNRGPMQGDPRGPMGPGKGLGMGRGWTNRVDPRFWSGPSRVPTGGGGTRTIDPGFWSGPPQVPTGGGGIRPIDPGFWSGPSMLPTGGIFGNVLGAAQGAAKPGGPLSNWLGGGLGMMSNPNQSAPSSNPFSSGSLLGGLFGPGGMLSSLFGRGR